MKLPIVFSLLLRSKYINYLAYFKILNANTLLSLVPVNVYSEISPGSMFSIAVWSFSSVESVLHMSLTRTKNKALVKTLNSISASFDILVYNLLTETWISVSTTHVFRKKIVYFLISVLICKFYCFKALDDECTSIDPIKLPHF